MPDCLMLPEFMRQPPGESKSNRDGFFVRAIDFCIDRSRLVNSISLVICALGLLSLFFIKRDLHPPRRFNEVEVLAELVGASAEEVERLITYPLEEALRSVPQLKEINSKTRAGRVRINLIFPPSVDNLLEKIEFIRGRVQIALRDLPPEIRNVAVEERAEQTIFLASIAVTGIDPRNTDHQAAMVRLESAFRSVSGVVDVQSTMKPLHIFIRFDDRKLNQAGMTVSQIKTAIQSAVEPSTIGSMSLDGKEWLLEFASDKLDPVAVSKLPIIQTSEGVRRTIGDVATVDWDFERNEKYHFLLGGRPAVELTVFKSVESDAMEVFQNLKSQFNSIALPKGAEVKVLSDGPYFIKQQLDVLVSNGFTGLVLVLAMLSLIMGRKTALMTAIGLPVCYLGTFFALWVFGFTIDLISLVALILVVGNLVDDAVIFGERYNSLLESGVDPSNAAKTAGRELITPVTATILTIICSFAPIAVLDSDLSRLFRALPFVVGIALLLSWFETFFILPNHLRNYVKTVEPTHGTKLVGYLENKYRTALGHIIQNRYRYLPGISVIFVFSLYIASEMPQHFGLSVSAPQVEIQATFQEDLNFEEITRRLKPLHDIFGKLDEDITVVESSVGEQFRNGQVLRGPRYVTIRLLLDKLESDVKPMRDRIKGKVAAVLEKEKIEGIASIAIASRSGERRMSVASVELRGRDEIGFQEVKRLIANEVAGKGSIGAYRPPDSRGPVTYRFILNQDMVRIYDFSPEELSFQIQAATGSAEVSRTRQGGGWLKLFIEPSELKEPTVESLENIAIQSPKLGTRIPLNTIGRWQQGGHSDAIDHRGGVRIASVDFEYDDEKVNEQVVQSDLRKEVEKYQSRFPGVEISVVDANIEDAAGRTWILEVALIAGVLIFIIIAISLRSLIQPFVVCLPIPFAIVGVVWANYLGDMPITLMGMIGLIGTMGVAVNDSIVMVDQINRIKHRDPSGDMKGRIVDGAVSRLRAIAVTASCTMLGVLPIAYGLVGESGFTQPLAYSMGWGLLSALLTTLFFVPAAIIAMEDLSAFLSKFSEIQIQRMQRKLNFGIQSLRNGSES